MNRKFRHLSLLLVIVLISTMLAACGGSDKKDAASPTVSGPTPTKSANAEPTATESKSGVETTPIPIAPTATIAVTPTPKPAEPVAVDALWFASDGQNVQGGTSKVKVSVVDKDGDDLRVGFFESEVGGSGPQWRAAGWMAVITASLLLAKDPSQYEFSFDVAGRIDGPSAGALMTSAVLAGYLGDTIDPSVTMTGTINPDGTIGPVGGIPHKIQGAAAAGKTTVLVPGGQRYDYDYALGQSVDLVQVGQANGVTVKLVPDIYTAYKELTGHDLPQPNSTGTATYPPSAFDKYRAGATSWYATYEQQRSQFTALPADIQAYRQPTIDAADYYASKADQFLGEGQVAAAYEYAFTAAAFATVAREAAELDNLYVTSGVDPLIQRLNSSSSATTQLEAIRQRLEAETPRTAADTIAIMDAFSNLSVAQGLIFEAQASINALQNNPDATEDDVLDTIYLANYNFVYANQFLKLAQDQESIGLGFGTAPAPNPKVLNAISETLRRGAEANVTYFEALIVEPFAQEYGVSSDIAQNYFLQSDASYLTAKAALIGADSLITAVTKPEAKAWVNLGSSLTSFSQSASLIAKYYSLGAQVDDTGYIVGYDRQSSLADMLDLADQRARAWLGAVASEDPVQSLYYYDNARLYRTGDAQDQLTALTYFWNSAILSQTLAAFTVGLK